MSIQRLMLLLLLLQLMTLIEVLLAAAASAQTTTTLSPLSDQVEVKRGCQDKCGNLSIPDPFGTTQGCYYNEDFLITCNHTYNPPKHFLRKSSIEVTDISVDGKLYIKQYIAKQCYKSGKPLVGFDNFLSLAKFFISDTDNKFVAVGCDTYAEIIGNKSGAYGYTGGCTTKCGRIDYVANYSCSGIGCCQTSIAKGMTSFEVSVTSFKNHTNVWNFSPCSYAFVVEEGKFNFSSNMLKDLEEQESLPAVLDWSIGNETCQVVKNQNNYACQKNSACVDVDNGSGYRCKCKDGYHGNPYLNGCLDINECENASLHDCKQNCINTDGGYNCYCRKGYHGEGRTNGEGCYPNQTLVVQITVGIGVSLLALLMGSLWFYLGYKRWKLMKLKEKFFRKNGGLMLQQQLSERQGSTYETAKIFSAEELEKATC